MDARSIGASTVDGPGGPVQACSRGRSEARGFTMRKRSRPRRRGRSVPFLATCCGTLTVAAVVAAVQSTPDQLRKQTQAVATVTDDWTWSAVDESPPSGGP